MKKLVTFMFILYSTTTFANDSFEKAMLARIAQLDTASSQEQLIAVANAFERIAQKESSEWLPLYYAGLAYTYLGFDQKFTLSEKDKYFAKAEELAANAAEVSANNSEITTLQGFALMGKLSADAANRGQSLSPQVMQLFGKAMAQNPDNPRALYLMAQMEMGVARFFGKSPDKACGMLKQSVVLFEAQPTKGIEPSWGYEPAKAILQQCSNEGN